MMNLAVLQTLCLGFQDQLLAFRLRRGSGIEGNVREVSLHCVTVSTTGAYTNHPSSHFPSLTTTHHLFLLGPHNI